MERIQMSPGPGKHRGLTDGKETAKDTKSNQ